MTCGEVIMILMIDNYDSFTFNLVQYIKEIGKEIIVKRNDAVSIAEIEDIQPSFILLSPGPGNPSQAGICLDIVDRFHREIPILGVCLGHQIIGQYFGGAIIKAKKPMHGKVSKMFHDGKSVFNGLPEEFSITRYHSLVVDKDRVPDILEVSAVSEDGEIMGIRHKVYPVEGVQFHPEAILTEYGKELLQNFFGREPDGTGFSIC